MSVVMRLLGNFLEVQDLSFHLSLCFHIFLVLRRLAPLNAVHVLLLLSQASKYGNFHLFAISAASLAIFFSLLVRFVFI